MIRQYLDNAAIGDPSAAALGNHPLQFGLQGAQACDSLLHLAEMRLGDEVGGGTGPVRVVGQAEQLANRIE